MTIEVNDLLKDAMAATGAKTYSECVDMALRMSLRAHQEERRLKKAARITTKSGKKTVGRRRSSKH
jgi:Arc/MetJ family transcription regulator